MGAAEMSSHTDSNGIKTIKSAQLGDIYARYFDTDLKYHSSWDWLVPAITKIKETVQQYYTDGELVLYKAAKSRLTPIMNELYNLDITNTHYCIAKFIQWYNSTLTNKT